MLQIQTAFPQLFFYIVIDYKNPSAYIVSICFQVLSAPYYLSHPVQTAQSRILLFLPPFRFTIIIDIRAQFFVFHYFGKLHAFLHLAGYICRVTQSVLKISVKSTKAPARKATLLVDFYGICYTGFVCYFAVRNTVIETCFDFAPYITRMFERVEIMCCNEEWFHFLRCIEFRTFYVVVIPTRFRLLY